MTIIVSAEEVQKGIQENTILPIDVRIKDEGYETGKEAYADGHLPGAVYLDFKEELTGDNSFFPDVETIKATLEQKGIDREVAIVLYDEGNHRAASKAYVLLTYLGHEHVSILNGGAPAWREAGYAWSDQAVHRPKTSFHLNLQTEILVGMEEVMAQLKKEDSVHIDSRIEAKYIGEAPSGYGKSGHIKGAKNFPAKHVMDEDGKMKSKSALQAHFTDVKDKTEHIVSCGTGNSACINLVALKEAGFEQVKLYAGGFKEWSQEDENEIETK